MNGFTHNNCMKNIRECIEMLKLINHTLSDYIEHNNTYDIAGIKAIHENITRRIFQNNDYLENVFDIHDYPRKRGYNNVQSEYSLLIEKINNRLYRSKSKPSFNYDALK